MKNVIIFFGTLIFAVFILASCGQNDKQKELELKGKELSQKDKTVLNDSVNSKKTQNELANNDMPEKKLVTNEYGEYFFTMPCAARPWYLSFKFILNTNKVLSSSTFMVANDASTDNSSGTFTVDKVNNEYKYVTCKFKSGGSYKLKYSIKKKKWIVLTDCDTAPEVEAD